MRIQPKIVVEALLPVPVRLGTARLLPLTIGGLLMLNRLESPFANGEEEFTALDSFVAGYVMSRSFRESEADHYFGKLATNAIAWAKEHNLVAEEVGEAVKDLIEAGFKPAAKTNHPPENGVQVIIETTDDQGNGLGLALTLLDIMRSDYDESRESALECPLATAFAYSTARNINRGEVWAGPNYYEGQLDFAALKTHIENMEVNKRGSQ